MPVEWREIRGSIATGGTAQLLCSHSRARNAFLFQNLSAGDLFLRLGKEPTGDGLDMQIASMEKLKLAASETPANDIYILGATNGQAFILWTDAP